MTRRRSRPLVVLVGLVVSGLVMLSWTQTWFTVHLRSGAAVTEQVAADGAAAVPQYSAFAIASLALFIALTIAGRGVRVVLGAVQIVLGLGVAWTGIAALSDPIAAAKGAVAKVAGVSDLDAVRGIVSRLDVSAWPVVGIVGGVLAAALGVVVLVVQRSWPGPSRKYGAQTDAAVAAARAATPVERDAVVDWDDLSAGVDPTLVDGAGPDGADGADGADRAGADAERAVDDTVGSTGRRSTDGAEAERGAP